MKLIFSENQMRLLENQKYTKSATYTDYPQSATNAAKRAIEWKEKYGDEVKGGTKVGWTRARQIANREALSYDVVKKIAQFHRHKKIQKLIQNMKINLGKIEVMLNICSGEIKA